MGQDLQEVSFNQKNRESFSKNLRDETQTLMKWFKKDAFEKFDVPKVGLEVECWLTDENFLPNPKSEEFLSKVNDENVVPEISQYNFELNTPPRELTKNVLSDFHNQLKSTWLKCQQTAKDLDSKCVLHGSLPTLQKNMLDLDYLYPNKRYFALNEQILEMRKREVIEIEINGKEHFSDSFKSIMLESAATSFQVHLQVSQETAKDFYNASLVASAFTSALSANSPFLFGKTLWSDTRIPVFEESIALKSYIRNQGRKARRVTLGHGYVRDSLFEIFLDNLDGYPVLLPDNIDLCHVSLNHVKLHNGTIWRWTRPILGTPRGGTPHLRIEHRVSAAGPSLTDIVADMAFYLGVVYYLVEAKKSGPNYLSFKQVRENFYNAAKYGLNAECHWDGQQTNLQEILKRELLPGALKSLEELGVSSRDLNTYFYDVLSPRVTSGQNGSNWQRAFVNTHGHRFQELMETYTKYQEQDLPIHLWKC